MLILQHFHPSQPPAAGAAVKYSDRVEETQIRRFCTKMRLSSWNEKENGRTPEKRGKCPGKSGEKRCRNSLLFGKDLFVPDNRRAQEDLVLAGDDHCVFCTQM